MDNDAVKDGGGGGGCLRHRVWHRLFLSTHLSELHRERSRLDAVVESKSALVDSLGPASHEQGLLMCEVLHKKYNEMKRQLVEVQAEYEAARKRRWKLVQDNHDESLRKHAAASHLQEKIHQARGHLHHIRRDTAILDLRAEKHFYMAKGLGARLFGDAPAAPPVVDPYDLVDSVSVLVVAVAVALMVAWVFVKSERGRSTKKSRRRLRPRCC